MLSSSTRQDAWSKEEDVVLATVVLRHIREGSTQLNAFEEVGAKLSRTPAACGFRWNSYVRKLYKVQIEKAKEERKLFRRQSANKKTDNSTLVENQGSTSIGAYFNKKITLEDVINYLTKLNEQKEYQFIKNEKDQLIKRITELENSINRLESENKALIEQLLTLEKTYKSVQSLIDKVSYNDVSEKST